MESYSAAVTTSLHDSKGSYQSSLLHEAKPAKNTAIVASVAAFAQSQVFPMRAPERARTRVVERGRGPWSRALSRATAPDTIVNVAKRPRSPYSSAFLAQMFTAFVSHTHVCVLAHTHMCVPCTHIRVLPRTHMCVCSRTHTHVCFRVQLGSVR